MTNSPPGDSLFGAWLYRWSMSPSFYVHAVVEDTGEPVPPDVVSEIVYSRPWFNLDPDLDSIPYDPPASLSAASLRPVEVAEVACPLDVVVRN